MVKKDEDELLIIGGGIPKDQASIVGKVFVPTDLNPSALEAV